MSLVLSGQSISFSPSSSFSAKAGWLMTHCFMFFRITGYPPRSLFPSITSSLLSTVPSSSHQFTGMSMYWAYPSRYSCLKIHWVHR